MFIFTRDIAAELGRLMHIFAEWRQTRAALAAARAEELRKRREEEARQKAAAAAAAKLASPAAPTSAPGTSKKMVVPKTNDPFTEQPRTATVPPMTKAAADVTAARTITRPPLKPAEPAPATKPLPAAGKFELKD